MAGGDWSSGKTSCNLFCVAEDIVTALMLNVMAMRGGEPYSVVLVHKKLEWARAALMDPLKAILPRTAQSDDGQTISLWFRQPGDENRERFGTKENHVVIRWIGLDRTAVDPADFKRSSENYDLGCFSQGDILSEEVLWAMDARIGRRPLPPPLRGQILGDSNATKNWIYRIFIKKQVADADPKEFFPLLSDTEDLGDILSDDFRKKMAERSEAKKRAARDWDYAPGQAFPEYDKRVSWIPFESIPFEATWKLKEAMDWGWAIHPAFYLWYCVDHSGNIWFLDELEIYRHDAPMQEFAVRQKREQLLQDIAAVVTNNANDQTKMYVACYGGPDLNQKESGVGKTKGDQLRAAGLNVRIVNPDVSGTLDREESKMTAFASALRVDPERKHPITGLPGAARIYISSRCPRFSEQVETAMIDVDQPKRIDKTVISNRFEPGEVHHWDGLDAGFIALQEERTPRRPEEKESFNPIWKHRRIDAAMNPEINRGF